MPKTLIIAVHYLVKRFFTVTLFLGFQQALFGSSPDICRHVFNKEKSLAVHEALYKASKSDVQPVDRVIKSVHSGYYQTKKARIDTILTPFFTSLRGVTNSGEERWYTPSEIGGGSHDAFEVDWLLKNPEFLLGRVVAGYTVFTDFFLKTLERLDLRQDYSIHDSILFAGEVVGVEVLSSDIFKRFWKLTVRSNEGVQTIFTRLMNDKNNRVFFLGKHLPDENVFSSTLQFSQVQNRIERVLSRPLTRKDIPHLQAVAGVFQGFSKIPVSSTFFSLLKGRGRPATHNESFGKLKGVSLYSEEEVKKLVSVFENFYMSHNDLRWDLIANESATLPTWANENLLNPNHIGGMIDYLEFIGSTLPEGNEPNMPEENRTHSSGALAKSKSSGNETDPSREQASKNRTEKMRLAAMLIFEKNRISEKAILEALTDPIEGQRIVKAIHESILGKFPHAVIDEKTKSVERIRGVKYSGSEVITYRLPLSSLLLNGGTKGALPVQELIPVAEVVFDKNESQVKSVEFALLHSELAAGDRKIIKRIQSDEFRKDGGGNRPITFDALKL